METIYVIFVNQYSVKYNKRGNITRVSIPSFASEYEGKELSKDFINELTLCGWKKPGIRKLCKILNSPKDISGGKLNPKTGKYTQLYCT